MSTELVVDFLSVAGPDNETVVTELSLVGAGVLQTYHFQRPAQPYFTPPQPTSDTLSGDEGHIPYSHLSTILRDTVAGYAHLYSHGQVKCRFLSDLVKRTFLDLTEFKCPEPHLLHNPKKDYSCGMPCHRFSSLECAARNAHSLYKWLTHHLQTFSLVTCPQPSISSSSFPPPVTEAAE